MPTYGQAKARDMARSILPSTARGVARRDGHDIKRANRRRTRQTLHQFGRCWDDPPRQDKAFVGDYTDAQSPGNYGWYDYGTGIQGVVANRRAHDKLGPVMRWARAIAPRLGDTPEERYHAMARLLGDNLPGRHAMTHIDSLAEYERVDEFTLPYGRDALARALAQR
jgi:hypothetical protein